ncbi:MAG: manganese efflux pump [Lachnospiraceae bacterium]|nr:manganese efflux pump [Lachnospiraceae bacterium]
MSWMELFLIAVGLSMDAFAVSVCQGLAAAEVGARQMIQAGAWFGGFQGLMPFIGFYLGSAFSRTISAFGHWIAFALLIFIGGNMVREALSGKKEETSCEDMGTMFVLALATSIDALAVGVTFALLPDVDIRGIVLLIGAVTFFVSGVGIRVGHVFGIRYKTKAEAAGGAILILIGVKILLDCGFG